MLKNIMQSIDGPLGMRWRLAVIFFLIGLCMHSLVIFRTHNEGDEFIYKTLVEQLDNGKGYTLQGSSLLEKGLIDRIQYDRTLFFHPPGGIALYWVFYKVFGDFGFSLVQLFSYALFFWSMLFLAKSLNLTSSNVSLALVAGLSAFSPIMSHVTTKLWLDGPLLAFTPLAAAVYVWAIVHNRTRWVFIAGLILGYASLIKITAFLVVPGLILLCWFFLKPRKIKTCIQLGLLFLATALIVQLPWELWQWIKVGSPFPSWAGRPSESLVESNKYVYYLTVIRSPWVYLKLTAIILWTSIPTLFLFILLWSNKSLRWLRLSLMIWILTVLTFHIILGFLGYSKVLRYVILMTPALIILFSSLLDEAVCRFKHEGNSANTGILTIIICISLLAYVMEILTGVNLLLFSHKDIIFPLLGGARMMQ
jgi:4-amino-4-deoxy-L-arabinose transferase-like glycosyltransferase